MSQIGQLQSSNDLQSALKGMVLQNQIASAGNLIGKVVTGIDENQSMVSGQVTSISVADNKVSLNLDNGKALDLNGVTQINGAPNDTVAAPSHT